MADFVQSRNRSGSTRMETVERKVVRVNPDNYFTEYTITYLKNNHKRLGYNYANREKEWMQEMITKSGLNVELKFVNDAGGMTGLTTIHKDGSATIELFNMTPSSVVAIDSFLHELAHAVDAHNYYLEHGDVKKLKEHGKSWKKIAVQMGTPPYNSLSMFDRGSRF
jgi:hypothetical protein